MLDVWVALFSHALYWWSQTLVSSPVRWLPFLGSMSLSLPLDMYCQILNTTGFLPASSINWVYYRSHLACACPVHILHVSLYLCLFFCLFQMLVWCLYPNHCVCQQWVKFNWVPYFHRITDYSVLGDASSPCWKDVVSMMVCYSYLQQELLVLVHFISSFLEDMDV